MNSRDHNEALKEALSPYFDLANPGTDNIRLHLKNEINYLIDADFRKLINLLYRLDVSEQKIRQVLITDPGTDAAELITDLVIERQLAKMTTRTHYTPDHDISDEEKW
jgi:hypothetical protein